MTGARSRPLLGMRILVTRPVEKGWEASETITKLGGKPLILPTIRIVPPSDYARLDRCLSSLNDYDWLLFTSANGVEGFFERAAEKGISLGEIRCKVATVGPSTASSLGRYGMKGSFIPRIYLTEKLASELPDVHGKRVLLVRIEGADSKMSSILVNRGAEVEKVSSYRVLPNVPEQNLEDFDAVLFTSPSTVLNFKSIFARLHPGIEQSFMVCCIGPVTARAAQEHGFRVDVVSPVHTMEGLIRALVERLSRG